MSFVDLNYYMYSTPVAAVTYVISRYTGPRYNGTWLYNHMISKRHSYGELMLSRRLFWVVFGLPGETNQHSTIKLRFQSAIKGLFLSMAVSIIDTAIDRNRPLIIYNCTTTLPNRENVMWLSFSPVGYDSRLIEINIVESNPGRSKLSVIFWLDWFNPAQLCDRSVILVQA